MSENFRNLKRNGAEIEIDTSHCCGRFVTWKFLSKFFFSFPVLNSHLQRKNCQAFGPQTKVENVCTITLLQKYIIKNSGYKKDIDLNSHEYEYIICLNLVNNSIIRFKVQQREIVFKKNVLYQGKSLSAHRWR